MKLLIVDDSATARDLLAEQLRRRGHEVTTAGDADAASGALVASRPDALLLDVMLPGAGTTPGELARRARAAGVRVVLCTALPEPVLPDLAADRVLKKPFAPEDVEAALAGLAPEESP